MPLADLFPDTSGEPLGLLLQPVATPDPFGDSRCFRFEYSSRGDRVPGRLLLPALATQTVPLILLQHGTRGSKEAVYLDVAAPWVKAGAAVASIDFPLHGERTSAKLSERFFGTLDSGSVEADEGAREIANLLWVDFTKQAVTDLRRSLDALTGHEEIDADRVGFGGFSLGGIIGALFCSVEPRVRGATLALAGGGLGPPEIDPCAAIGDMAPRPLLFLNTLEDQRIPRTATDALYAAAGDPKQIEWFPGGHTDLPGRAMKSMWQFFCEVLEIETAR